VHTLQHAAVICVTTCCYRLMQQSDCPFPSTVSSSPRNKRELIGIAAVLAGRWRLSTRWRRSWRARSTWSTASSRRQTSPSATPASSSRCARCAATHPCPIPCRPCPVPSPHACVRQSPSLKDLSQGPFGIEGPERWVDLCQPGPAYVCTRSMAGRAASAHADARAMLPAGHCAIADVFYQFLSKVAAETSMFCNPSSTRRAPVSRT